MFKNAFMVARLEQCTRSRSVTIKSYSFDSGPDVIAACPRVLALSVDLFLARNALDALQGPLRELTLRAPSPWPHAVTDTLLDPEFLVHHPQLAGLRVLRLLYKGSDNLDDLRAQFRAISASRRIHLVVTRE